MKTPFTRHCTCPDYWDRCPKCGGELPTHARRHYWPFVGILLLALVFLCAILEGLILL